MITSECKTSWLWNIKTRALVTRAVQERNPDAANRLNDVFKCAEVNIDIVVDVDIKIVFDSAY